MQMQHCNQFNVKDLWKTLMDIPLNSHHLLIEVAMKMMTADTEGQQALIMVLNQHNKNSLINRQ